MALMKMPTNVGSGGGMRYDSGSTSLSTTQNTRVDLGFAPKIIKYNTKGASGSQSQYFYDVVYFADSPFVTATKEYEVCYTAINLDGVTPSSRLDDVGNDNISNRGALMVVDSTGFTVGLCDTTGYGQSLNWEAWG